MDLYFSPAAQVELDEAFAYLEGEQPGLGYRFTADMDEAPLVAASLAPLISLAGELPPSKHKLVVAWIEIHQDDLVADWELAVNGKKPFPIKGLDQ